jgi:hypothetical protein
MFDFRYHVASLAAVFLALVLGILIGVAISGRGFVDKSERNLLNGQIRDLRQERDAERALADELQTQQSVSEDFITQAYPVLMQDRLKGKRIVVLVLGAGGGETAADVADALDDAGAKELRYRALKVPVDPKALDRALGKRPALRAYAGDTQLDDLAHELASELVGGGKTPVWDALAKVLVEQQRGDLERPADGLVLIRAVKPQSGPTARFLAGLYEGLATSGKPAVGVESSSADPSAVSAWSASGLSSVDDVDTLLGRLALGLVLAGSSGGQYGIKEGAKPLPPLTPVT